MLKNKKNYMKFFDSSISDEKNVQNHPISENNGVMNEITDE